jgi:hypothetical protein
VDTVWSQGTFNLACRALWDPHVCWLEKWGISIGVDCALYGDDDTCICVRCGPLVVHLEAHNGWEYGRTAGRVKELCRTWAAWYNAMAQTDRPPLDPLDVDVTVEMDGGYGAGVLTHAAEFYRWRGLTVGGKSDVVDQTGDPKYSNIRAEIWFEAAALARGHQMDLSRLPPEVLGRLRVELTTPFTSACPTAPAASKRKRTSRSDSVDRLTPRTLWSWPSRR